MSNLGFQVLQWDIKWGAEYDLLQAKHRSLIRGWILSRLVVALHLGIPCSSWTRARDRPGGPPPLRSDSEIWGLPDLRPGDAVAVHRDNVLAKFSASVLFVCRHLRVPATVENSQTSRLWLAPPIKRFLSCARVSLAVTDFWQPGEKWLKPTKVGGCFVDLQALERRCRFRILKHCSASGEQHVCLQGQTAQGRPFARQLAKILKEGVISCRVVVLCRVINQPSAMPTS